MWSAGSLELHPSSAIETSSVSLSSLVLTSVAFVHLGTDPLFLLVLVTTGATGAGSWILELNGCVQVPAVWRWGGEEPL